MKRNNKKKLTDSVEIEVLTEFFTMVEDVKTKQLSKITNEIEKLKNFKTRLGIHTDLNLGLKRRA